MNDVWYWPVYQAFRKHLELAHEDKEWQGDNNEEARFFEEHLAYERFKDGEVQHIGCCWVDCEWSMKFAVKYELAAELE